MSVGALSRYFKPFLCVGLDELHTISAFKEYPRKLPLRRREFDGIIDIRCQNKVGTRGFDRGFLRGTASRGATALVNQVAKKVTDDRQFALAA